MTLRLPNTKFLVETVERVATVTALPVGGTRTHRHIIRQRDAVWPTLSHRRQSGHVRLHFLEVQ